MIVNESKNSKREKYLYWMLILILDAYTRHQSRVSWNNCFSKYFSVSNGVKQGGVLSPTLFSMYIDKLLLKLKESGYGCHLNGIYMGALAYADDITITCPSRRGLHKMLVLCNNFGNENYIIFNTKKTLCVKYGEPVNDHEYIYLKKLNKTGMIRFDIWVIFSVVI